MKDESKKEKILGNEENEFSSTRRTFVKRSMSTVPIVMTLRSGAAFAATSATCMVKLTNGNIGADPVLLGENDENFNSDKWVRSSTARQAYKIQPPPSRESSPPFWVFEINPDSNIFISDDSRTDKSSVQYELVVPSAQAPANSISGGTDPNSTATGTESGQSSGFDGSASPAQATDPSYFQVINTPTVQYTIIEGPLLKFVTIIADKNGEVVGLGLDNTSGDGTANAFDSCWSSLGLGAPNI